MSALKVAGGHAPSGTTYTLLPGEVRCAQRDDQLVTLLGSCVAIVLTDPKRTVGCMSHIVHIPSHNPPTGPRGNAWADVALATMCGELRAKGIEPRLCEAYVYGGGNMFPTLVGGTHVGQRNANWVLDALAVLGATLLHQDLGGSSYRKLRWTIGPQAPQVEAVPV
jgi:chemotaxis protein CheD